MSNNNLSEYTVFLYSCIFGLITGLIYDIIRIIKEAGFNSKQIVFIMDITFMLLMAPLTFLFCCIFNDGIVRFFILSGEAIGFFLYRYTVGEITVRVFSFIMKPIRWIFKLVKKPVNIFISFIVRKYSVHKNKALKKAAEKKTFSKKNKKTAKTLLPYNPFLVYNTLRNKDSARINHRNEKNGDVINEHGSKFFFGIRTKGTCRESKQCNNRQ